MRDVYFGTVPLDLTQITHAHIPANNADESTQTQTGRLLSRYEA